MTPRSAAQTKAQTRAQDRIAAVHSATRARSKRTAPAPEDDRDVYRKLISEASIPEGDEERPLKKPRLGRHRQTQQPDNTESVVATSDKTAKSEQASGKPISRDLVSEDEIPRPQQTIIDSEESDDDLDWEQVGLDHVEPQPSTSRKDDEFGDVSLEISTKKAEKKTIAKRKPATTAEKLLRLEAHEAHLMFLLFHVHVRNAWCSMTGVQNKLKTILSPEIVSLLNPDQSLIQFGRSQQFLTGLQRAVLIWKAKFNVTASGIRQSTWADGPDGIKEQIKAIQDEMPPVDKEAFVDSAASLSGSQDVGNQLFCALLRCVGVETRLVCSLQPLPFGASVSKTATPQKGKTTIYADDHKGNNSAAETSAGEASAGSASEGSSTPRRRIIAPGRIRRLGQQNLNAGPSTAKPSSSSKKKRPVRKLDYPVFWVEAFNAAYQKWVPVDAIVTCTVAKPSKLEPPASYESNTMTYVVGFEDNGIARDITRRYTKAYNAKTRKLRVESTEGGEKWWRKALKAFQRSSYLDRDQVEDAELAKKDASEGLPNNVQDFKGHPYYALERHLKRHEVIWPKREAGKISTGKGASSIVEPVYRRSDVQIVRSADKWYRFGREIKPGEQPLKHVPARMPKGRAQDLDDTDMDEPPATALYGFSQTSLYVPPPVVHGRIPKNAYGNLDIYVPSMIPPGGFHIRHTAGQKAARLLGVDYADAVTGFQFKGRHGTAITSGVVVAAEYREAVEAVIEGFEYAQENEEARLHSLECLRLWRRFLAGLRIKERLSEYNTNGSRDVKPETVKEKMDEAEDEQEEPIEAGGFFPDAGEITAPTAHQFKTFSEPEHEYDLAEQAPRLRRQRKTMVESDAESDEQSEEEYMPSPRKAPVRRRRILEENFPETENEYDNTEIHDGGGLIPEAHEDTENGGGFFPDADANDLGGDFMPENIEADKLNQSGGGFIHDDAADESGGGFIPDNGAVQDDETGGGFIPEEEPTAQSDTEMQGGGFVPEEEEAEDDTFDPDEMDIAPTTLNRENSTAVHGKSAHVQAEQGHDEEEEDDRGSLLSHDPEDDDAEPEWLNSD